MFSKLKSNARNSFIRRTLEERNLDLRNAPLQSMGFVLDETWKNKEDFLYNFGKNLGLHQKDMKVMYFSNKSNAALQPNVIGKKDFMWSGRIKSTITGEFFSTPFDVLIALHKNNREYFSYIVAQSEAKLKIGFEGADERVFDLILNLDTQNEQLVVEELKKYLRILNKI